MELGRDGVILSKKYLRKAITGGAAAISWDWCVWEKYALPVVFYNNV